MIFLLNGLYAFQITDIACGYGFTLVATKNKDKNLKLFGCGLNSDSQIGKLS